MSKFNKKTLALALVAALAAPTAFALVVNTDGNASPEVIASEVGTEVTMTEAVEFTTEMTDSIIGRTTGLQVIVTLQDGARFGAIAPVLTPGDALVGNWSTTLAAGGTSNDTQAVFTFSPDGTNSAIEHGVFAQLNNLNLQNVSTEGQTRLQVQLRDPVTGTALEGASQVIISRESGLDVDCTANANAYKIDVGTSEEFDPRTGLVDSPYEIGGAEYTTTYLGQISIAATGFTLNPGDELASQITTNGSLAGFSSIFLSGNNSCDSVIQEYEIDLATNTASFSQDNLFGEGTTSSNTFLCATVDGVTQIEAQQFDVTIGVNDVDHACPVAPLQSNGSLVKVYHVNPAGNTQAQSFVRVINQSNTGGNVTVTGWDDAGNKAEPISFYLDARQSMQFNSVDLEEGNEGKGIAGSFGDGAGKWRLEVLGEFDNMVVQGLNRNRDTGTVTNLTDADGQFEQELLHRTTPFGL